MKKKLSGLIALSAIFFVVHVSDASVKVNSFVNSPPGLGKFEFNQMSLAKPTNIYVGRLPDPFNSNIQYDLYGSGGVLTAAYEIYYGTNIGPVSVSGTYRAETGAQTGWYLDSGTLTNGTESFNFFEALYVDLT